MIWNRRSRAPGIFTASSARSYARAESRSEQRRQSLIEAAYHLIARGGFERLRTREVAAQAGVNIATLHYYFARVVEYLLRQFLTAYLPGSPFEMQTPWEQIRGELAEMEYLWQKRPEMFIVMNELILRSLHDAAIRTHITWLETG
ncbi:MAG TPA: TetR family transcriptional regulator [Ktedonobacteraceae bacterium]|jgi:AcrR family transcriptional regulator